MNFRNLVLNLLKESPDTINYNGEEHSYNTPDGDPITFFVATVVVRPDIKKGYDSDIDTPLGMCIVYSPTHISPERLEKAYLEDPQNKFFTHWNLSGILNYNEVYSYDELLSLGINVHSFRTDANAYFQKVKKRYPRMAFALRKNEEAIGLKYKGRVWRFGDKFVVSTWDFDKKIAEAYIIPFLKQKFGASEDNIEIEVSSALTDDKNTGNFISGSSISNAQKQPYEKEINQLLSKLHTTSGPDKEAVRQQLKQLLNKHGLDPKKYGISDDILKSSQHTAQKTLGPEDIMAQIRSKERTSESLSTDVP
jgi:hypothetical protein